MLNAWRHDGSLKRGRSHELGIQSWYTDLIQGCYLFPFYSSPRSSKNHHHCLVAARQSLTDSTCSLLFTHFSLLALVAGPVVMRSKSTKPSGVHTCPASCSSVRPSLSLLAAANLCNISRLGTCYSHGYHPPPPLNSTVSPEQATWALWTYASHATRHSKLSIYRGGGRDGAPLPCGCCGRWGRRSLKGDYGTVRLCGRVGGNENTQ